MRAFIHRIHITLNSQTVFRLEEYFQQLSDVRPRHPWLIDLHGWAMCLMLC